MAKAEEFPFETFPYGEIHVSTPRRKFLSAVMTEIKVYNKSSKDHQGRKLSDLGRWNTDELLCVVPMLIPGSRVEIKQEYICITPNGGRPLMLFSLHSPALFVFNLFDGMNTLDEIAEAVSRQNSWSDDKSFAYTRGVFLSLVAVGVCQPKW